jgi:hypothetical protein
LTKTLSCTTLETHSGSWIGPKPTIGAHIALGDVRMTVQAGFSDELWHWLTQQGWRELTHRPDRRHYRAVPASCVMELIDASSEQRPLVLVSAMARASLRPIIGGPNGMSGDLRWRR